MLRTSSRDARSKSFGRHALIVVLLLIIASCGGGGCSSGCSGCGMQPLPGGFPRAQAVPNAGAVRLTRPGLDFIGQNLPALASKILGTNGSVLHFNIPKTDTSFSV